MTERLDFARPMMRRSTGLDANQAWRQLLEERQDVAALQLTANEHLAFCVNAVHLKDRLGNVKTDGGDRLHDWLLRIPGALTAPPPQAPPGRQGGRPHDHTGAHGGGRHGPHVGGPPVPVEEPSTASKAGIRVGFVGCPLEELTTERCWFAPP